MSENKFMRMAIELSKESVAKGGGPFGAVIVRDDQVIATGSNSVTLLNDPTAHAEVSAIRAACQAVGDFNLKGCVIYSSCEPCPMCLSAIYWAGIERIYYANNREDAAAIGFDDALIYDQIPLAPTKRTIPLLP
ncbi:MAG: nucleoside deaminase, partial [Tidjanibacter sp.]|nr:nucleoside deaminase [Tidjanibacter sp.]